MSSLSTIPQIIVGRRRGEGEDQIVGCETFLMDQIKGVASDEYVGLIK